jgi:hypothetical protein
MTHVLKIFYLVDPLAALRESVVYVDLHLLVLLGYSDELFERLKLILNSFTNVLLHVRIVKEFCKLHCLSVLL